MSELLEGETKQSWHNCNIRNIIIDINHRLCLIEKKVKELSEIKDKVK